MLRPFVKDLHTSLTSRKLAATDPSRGSNWRGSTQFDKKGLLQQQQQQQQQQHQGYLLSRGDEESQKKATYELAGIPEEPSQALKLGYHADAYYSPSEVDLRIQDSHTKPIPLKKDSQGSWPL